MIANKVTLQYNFCGDDVPEGIMIELQQMRDLGYRDISKDYVSDGGDYDDDMLCVTRAPWCELTVTFAK